MNFGVKLLSYNGQQFNAWVYKDDKVYLLSNLDEANKVLADYKSRNPNGNYIVEVYGDNDD